MEVVKEAIYKIAVVGSEPLTLGFKLSGVTEAYTPESQQKAESMLRELMQRDDMGLIVVTTKITKNIKDRRLSESISQSIMPMVLEVPDYNEECQPDVLSKLILRAIGIDISKNIR